MTIDYRTGEIVENLSDVERVTLGLHEDAIREGMASFVTMGSALFAIREGRLYRASHDTFSLYCAERWNLNYRYVNRIIEASSTVEQMGPMGPTPATERQARELNGLTAEAAVEVMTQAHETTEGKPTAAAIRAAREQMHPRPEPKPPEPDSADPVGGVGAPSGSGSTSPGGDDAPQGQAEVPPSTAGPAESLVAAAVAEFPDLAYYAEQDDDERVLRLAEALRKYGDSERRVRLEALRATIAADQRREAEPAVEREPDPAELTDEIFHLANALNHKVTTLGGPDVVHRAMALADPLESDYWRDEFAALITTATDLHAATKTTLRRIK